MRTYSGAMDRIDTPPSAFLVVRHNGDIRILELPPGAKRTVGSADTDDFRIDALLPSHLTVEYFGERIKADTIGDAYRNGKPFDTSTPLEPGDELAVGDVQLAIGIAGSPAIPGRRTLSHNEFRERLYEEVARAVRAGRPTTLALLQARSGDGRRLSATAIETFRAGDVVGSYAPNLIEVLLPDTHADVARVVLERILARAEASAVIGLAVSPSDADDPEHLLASAHTGLMNAMRSGEPFGRGARAPGSDVIIGSSPAMTETIAEVQALATSDVNVTVVGERSTGRTLLARTLHARSTRAHKSFVIIPCANNQLDDRSLTTHQAEVLAAQLRLAQDGTLLLHELDELDPKSQRIVRDALRTAGSRVRIIATTTRSLPQLVERGAFDAELLEIVARSTVSVPALRNRPEDLIPLVEVFAREAGARLPLRISAGAVARLRSYPWPSNVIELRNAVERAVLLAADGDIMAEHLPHDPLPITATRGGLRDHVDSVERDAIVKALAECNQNQTHAAKRLGLSRRALIYKMEKYALKAPPKTVARIGQS